MGRAEPRYFGSTTQLLHASRQITDPNGRTRTFLLHPKTGDWYEWPESFPRLPNYALLPWPAPLETEGIRRQLRTPQDVRDFLAGVARGFVKQNVEDVLSIPKRLWDALTALPSLGKRGYDIFAAILNNDKDKLDYYQRRLSPDIFEAIQGLNNTLAALESHIASLPPGEQGEAVGRVWAAGAPVGSLAVMKLLEETFKAGTQVGKVWQRLLKGNKSDLQQLERTLAEKVGPQKAQEITNKVRDAIKSGKKPEEITKVLDNELASIPKEMKVGEAGHHAPAVRKSRGRPFEVDRGDKSRPTIHVRGDERTKAQAHWRMHNAERDHIGPRQGDFPGTDKELFDAYRESYKGLGDIRVDVKSPDGRTTLGTNVTLIEAMNLIEKFLGK